MAALVADATATAGAVLDVSDRRPSDRDDAHQRSLRLARLLLRHAHPGLLHDRGRQGDAPYARPTHDRGGPLHAPPLHGLQQSRDDRTTAVTRISCPA